MTSTPEVTSACYLAVLRALELAARRRHDSGRNTRRAFPEIPAYLTHTRLTLAHNPPECDKLLRDAWPLLVDTLDAFGIPSGPIVAQCDLYVRELITTRQAPHREELAHRLTRAYTPT